MDRRKFLQLGGAVAVAAIIPVPVPPNYPSDVSLLIPETSMAQAKRCFGLNSFKLFIQTDTPGVDWVEVTKIDDRRVEDIPLEELSEMCKADDSRFTMIDVKPSGGL